MTKLVDKKALANAFGRAAAQYDNFATLQRISGDNLLQRISQNKISTVLDAGCGTGWYSRHFRQAGCEVTALDLSLPMLENARQQQAATHYIEGDIEALPLADEQVCLSWSNLAVQWCNQLQQALQELYRVTRVGGSVAFSTLAAGSLTELNCAWQHVDDYPHSNQFLSFEQINHACKEWQCSLVAQSVTLDFPDVLSAMRSLKGIGATHLHQGRRDSVLTRRQLQMLTLGWPQKNGHFALTYQLVYGVIERE